MMVDLALHEVRWSAEQGHPVLDLGIGGDANGVVSIALAPADAEVLAARPPATAAARLRLIGLLEHLLGALNGRLTEVRFRLDNGMVLVAELQIDLDQRQITLQSHFADGIALAVRTSVPMRISEMDLRWIRAVRGGAESKSAQATRTTGSPLETALHRFIESLQLDDLSGPPHELSDREL